MKLDLSLYKFKIPLVTPYKLSFGSLKAFETFYVVLDGKGSIGIGEITILTGYSSETPESLIKEFHAFLYKLKDKVSYKELVKDISCKSPFLASGLACAYETWHEGPETAFFSPVPKPVPLVGFCGGDNAKKAVENAQELVARGFQTLKMKVGALSIPEDVSKIRAVYEKIPSYCKIRLDANQAYSMEKALKFCRMLEDVKTVEFIEQPFRKNHWGMNEELVKNVQIPLMLDESVWTEDDVVRAADCGASFVKFKLCKHLGMEGSKKMLGRALRLGLGVVYGNGVQTAVGNHLEARLHHAVSIKAASESNGFLKPIQSPINHRLTVMNGNLIDGGIEKTNRWFQKSFLIEHSLISIDL